MDSTCRELEAAEILVDEILMELDALCEMTGKDGRLKNLLEMVLLKFSKTPYLDMLEQRKQSLEKKSKIMEKPQNKTKKNI